MMVKTGFRWKSEGKWVLEHVGLQFHDSEMTATKLRWYDNSAQILDSVMFVRSINVISYCFGV